MTSRQRKRVKRYLAEPRFRGRYCENALASGRVGPTIASLAKVLGAPSITTAVGPYREQALRVDQPNGRTVHVLGDRYTLRDHGYHRFSFVSAPEIFDV